jgi:S-adenosylmethionine:tRNA ribosyltransferase-isomerase
MSSPDRAASSSIRIQDYDYPLPEERIAQEPVAPRDASRLMVLDRGSRTRVHRRFRELPALLRPRDLLVLNDTRVVPARLVGRKMTGGVVECLLLEEIRPGGWEALCNGTRELRPGTSIRFGDVVEARVGERRGETVVLEFPAKTAVPSLLEAWGEVPLPPYIHRSRDDRPRVRDRDGYQTIYARNPGAVAAPTAGLHFTEDLLSRLAPAGVETAFLTLHVGAGTFLPIREEDARDHRIHSEAFRHPEEAALAVRRTRERGGRVVAVGTTVARVLESLGREGAMRPAEGRCDLYVLPGHRFDVVDALITNFHLPRSTLLLFVAAFAGRDWILESYREAVERHYRFYSYGDAMLIQ